jgi:hypothetical protein
MTLLYENMGTESQREDGFPVEAQRFKVAHTVQHGYYQWIYVGSGLKN